MLEPLQSSGIWWSKVLKGTTVPRGEQPDVISTEGMIVARQGQRQPQDRTTILQPEIPSDPWPTTMPTSFKPILP
jgi:hypothetical protein